ncbi:hypothetical protein AC1031_007468 [Aphanomyces cochlioides]|nr:hypothetical protein AC1031_007468 [Aphanomyces cochlioides]
MGLQYSVQALTQSEEHGLVLHPKYLKYLQLHCPDFAMPACKVTARMREIVLASWDDIANGKAPGMEGKLKDGSAVVYFYDRFYSSLFALAPEVKPLFRQSIIVQGKALIAIVQTVTNEANTTNVIEKVADLAYRHNKYGVKLQYYNILGKNLLNIVKECTGSTWNEEKETAWRTVYAFMMVAMTPILYHGRSQPTEKERNLAKQGKTLHNMTFRRPRTVEPTANMTSINPGQCPVAGTNVGECPYKP